MDQNLETLRAALADRYRVGEAIGRGGMATVYLAHDLRHDRRVAIKVMSPELAATIGVERFSREVKIAAKLSHPNILGVFDSGDASGLLYYVMPFVDGETLRAKLMRERQIAIDESIQIVCEVAEALGHAHAQGVVHRDIKPENILLQDGRALVADFGIARMAEAGAEKLTKTGMAVGTAQYMSPEQAAGEPTDARSDIYALACTLFEMLAGQPPFTGANAMAIMSQHSMATIPEVRVMRHGVPEELDAVIRKAMEKTPADRFQTMEEFKRAVLGEIPVTAHALPRYTARYRTQTAAQRRSVAWRNWILTGALAAGILAVGGFVAKQFLTPRAALPDANKVAVLYFEDETGGALQFLADGLTEGLIERLQDVSALQVVSAGGVRPLRGRAVTSDSIRSAFGIGTIVKGSVRREGPEAKVSISVVDAASDASYGRKTVTVDTAQLATLQESVADEAARFLREAIGEEMTFKQNRVQTRSTAAWTLAERAAKLRKEADSLLGMRAGAPAAAALARADSLLSQAQALDSRWPRLPAMRASNAFLAAQLKPRKSDDQRMIIDSGLAMATHALELQQNNADALEARGRLLYLQYILGFESDPAENGRLLDSAQSALIRAVQLNDRQAGAWATLSTLYYSLPNIPEAYRAAEKAYRADAYLASANQTLRRLFWTSHDRELFPEAFQWCNEGRRRYPADPFFVECRLWMFTTPYGPAATNPDSAWAYHGRYVEMYDGKARAFADRNARILVAGALARAGRADSARKLLESARATPDVDPGRELAGNEAVVRVILGDYDTAVQLIETYLSFNPAHRQGFATRVSPWWRDLQGHPRFKRLVSTAR